MKLLKQSQFWICLAFGLLDENGYMVEKLEIKRNKKGTWSSQY